VRVIPSRAIDPSRQKNLGHHPRSEMMAQSNWVDLVITRICWLAGSQLCREGPVNQTNQWRRNSQNTRQQIGRETANCLTSCVDAIRPIVSTSRPSVHEDRT